LISLNVGAKVSHFLKISTNHRVRSWPEGRAAMLLIVLRHAPREGQAALAGGAAIAQ
jgi:hypothetical protein